MMYSETFNMHFPFNLVLINENALDYMKCPNTIAYKRSGNSHISCARVIILSY